MICVRSFCRRAMRSRRMCAGGQRPQSLLEQGEGEGMNMLGVLLMELRSNCASCRLRRRLIGIKQLRKSRIVSERFG